MGSSTLMRGHLIIISSFKYKYCGSLKFGTNQNRNKDFNSNQIGDLLKKKTLDKPRPPRGG